MNPKQRRLYILSRLKNCGAWRRKIAIGKAIGERLQAKLPNGKIEFIRVDYVENAYGN